MRAAMHTPCNFAISILDEDLGDVKRARSLGRPGKHGIRKREPLNKDSKKPRVLLVSGRGTRQHETFFRVNVKM